MHNYCFAVPSLKIPVSGPFSIIGWGRDVNSFKLEMIFCAIAVLKKQKTTEIAILAENAGRIVRKAYLCRI
jgi:hypothetical protein